MATVSLFLPLLVYTWMSAGEAGLTTYPPSIRKAIYKDWDYRYFPNPIANPIQCGRGQNKSFVCDPEKVLEHIQAKQLDELISSNTRSMRCACQKNCVGLTYKDRYIILVAIVPKVKVKAGATMDEKKSAVDQFATNLQSSLWAEGHCENDIVIALSTEFQRMYAAVGKRIETFIPEDCRESSANESSTLIADGFYFKAVYNFIEQLSLDLQREECVRKGEITTSGSMGTPPWVVYVVAGIISVILILFLLVGIRKYRKYRRNQSNRDTNARVVYRPASRELVDQYEGDTETSAGGYPFSNRSNSHDRSTSRSPISRSHGSGKHHYDPVDNRELGDPLERDTHTSSGGYPFLNTSKTPISRSHGGGKHHDYDHDDSHDGYGRGSHSYGGGHGGGGAFSGDI